MTDAPPPPPPPSPPPARRGPGPWPIILIAVGVLLLIANFGWLNLGALLGLLNYWPVALVAVGINLLTNGRYATPLALGAIVVAVILWSAEGGVQRVWGAAPAGETIDVRHDLQGAGAARVTLHLGVGRVRVDDAASSGALATGTIQTGRGEQVEQSYGREDGIAVLELRSRQTPGTTTIGTDERRSWELSLTREVPLALHVNAGVGENRLDLRQAQLVDLSFRGGVGESHVQLPAGDYAASVEVGVGATTVRLPPAAAARVTVTTGLGRSRVEGDWRRDGDVYTTPGFENAAERIELRVRGGVGAITVDRR
jgi:hypothetical protein